MATDWQSLNDYKLFCRGRLADPYPLYHRPDRQRPAGPAAAPRPDEQTATEPVLHRTRRRGMPALRRPHPTHFPGGESRLPTARHEAPPGTAHLGHAGRRQPRPPTVPPTRPLRHPPPQQPPRGLRLRRPPLPGAPLARVEGQIAFQALLRLPKLRLETPTTEWQEGVSLRTPKALAVRFRGVEGVALDFPPGAPVQNGMDMRMRTPMFAPRLLFPRVPSSSRFKGLVSGLVG